MMTLTFTPRVVLSKKKPPIVGIKSVLNMTRLNWRTKAAYLRQHREMTGLKLLTLGKPPKPPVHVRLVRIGKRKMDYDGYVTGFKGIRDSVADWLGVDDGDESKVTFEYAQEKGEPAVRIEIEGK